MGLTSALPSSHNFKSYTTANAIITTGQPVNLQILWTGTQPHGLQSAAGLAINNSGVLFGSQPVTLYGILYREQLRW